MEGERYRYRFSPTSSDSIFSSCFVLFILDLLKATENLSVSERRGWARYIQSFQNADDGLFYPERIYHPDKERAVFQLSCFCLSALAILDTMPKYRVKVVDRWKNPEDVERYCRERGCHVGARGSGNKAMFQAVMLTHEYERSGKKWLKDAIEAWFALHDKYQNAHGFWGATTDDCYYHGLQNGFHQAVVYEYWERDFNSLVRAVETALLLQDKNGFFSAALGGGACKDYDAIHFLILGYKSGVLKEDIASALMLANHGLNSTWNAAGGFSESAWPSKKGFKKVFFFLRHFQAIRCWPVAYLRTKAVAKDILLSRKHRNRSWVGETQSYAESTVWDTWFRWLGIAQINSVTNEGWSSHFRFQKHIGLGYSGVDESKDVAQTERIQIL